MSYYSIYYIRAYRFMRFLQSILFLSLVIPVTLQAQEIRSRIISRLLHEENAVTHVHHHEFGGLFLDKVDPKYKKNHQYLLKTSRGLFFGVEGTGCMYKVFETKNGLIDVERIDSTVYAGNNFCAANFTIDSVIYSFGGYGFWRTNGLLKLFNPYSKEWDVMSLSDERPSIFCESGSGFHWKNVDSSNANTKEFGTTYAPSMFWVDSSKKLFFEVTQRFVNEAIGDSNSTFQNVFIPTVNVLDLRTNKWRSLGNLIDYGWHHLVQTPWGLLVVENSDHIYLADFHRNQRRYCSAAYAPLYRKLFVNNPPQVVFYSDGFVYMGSPDINSYDSIPLNLDQFLPSVLPLYKGFDEKKLVDQINSYLNSPRLTYPIGMLIGFLISLFFYRRSGFARRTRVSSYTSVFRSSVSTSERVNMLTETEKGLIQLIVNNSMRGERTSIEEVNKAIGVSGKNEPIKRRVRSEVINSINEKWIIISATRERLIDAAKSAGDGRGREYFIAPEILASPTFHAALVENNS